MKPPWAILAAFMCLAIIGGYAIQRSAHRTDDAFRKYQLDDCVIQAAARDDQVERESDIRAINEDLEKFPQVAKSSAKRRVRAGRRIERTQERARLNLPRKLVSQLTYEERCLKARPELRP